LADLINACGGQESETLSSTYIGAGLDPTGQWAYIYDDIVLRIDALNGGNYSGSINILSSPDWYWHYVGRITMNSTGRKYAVAYEEGAVRIFSQDISMGLFSPDFSENVDGDNQAIPALAFSPADKWLARIRADRVSVWRVRGLGGRLQYESDLPGARFLAFDNSEKLLFVGANETITVIDLAKKSVLATLSTPDLTALTISSDDRLMIWGDSTGAIHLWGVPER
jgi:WD40 repeat protein